jgi:aminoglycoside 6'-N-acetyltransferase I
MSEDDLARRVRPVGVDDEAAAVELRARLWPDETTRDHLREVRSHVLRRPITPLDATMLVCDREPGPGICGLIEVELRFIAEGCTEHSPVGYIKGWCLDMEDATAVERDNVVAAFIRAAEWWARARGCVAMAAQTSLSSGGLQDQFRGLGYGEVDRIVHYRKSLI